MKNNITKKKKNDEIKITNYMDDFNNEIENEDTFQNTEDEIKDNFSAENENNINTNDISDEVDDYYDDIEKTSSDLIEENDELNSNNDTISNNVNDDDYDDIKEVSIDDLIKNNEKINNKNNQLKEKKRKRRYKLKKASYILIVFIIIIVILISYLIKRYNYMHSDEYYLLEKGYTIEEVKIILEDKEITKLFLNHEYNENILSFINEKYYLPKNLDKYLTYKEKNKDKSNAQIISIINTGADKQWYDDIKETDTSLNELMLVNKFNYIKEDYEIEDLVDMSVKYAFSGRKLREIAYEAFIEMANKAKEENLKIVANTAYRTYEYQQKQYTYFKNQKGLIYADSKAARPGHSEHQTGLAIDISTLDTTIDFETTEEFTWLKNNAHKFGFIMRYPKEKEYITGYNYEPYHYRYVGKDAAKIIYDENITFEEYYAFYIEGNK